MSYQLYEVWTEDEDGHQELLETTSSEKAANELANKAVLEGSFVAIVFLETEEGEIIERHRFQNH